MLGESDRLLQRTAQTVLHLFKYFDFQRLQEVCNHHWPPLQFDYRFRSGFLCRQPGFHLNSALVLKLISRFKPMQPTRSDRLFT